MNNVTALLLDDNRNNLTILQRELLKNGFLVTAINHPSRLKETLQRIDHIDLIFLDLEMPTISGYDVFKQLRELGIDVPIVAHSVHVDHMTEVRAKGFSGFIPKPLDTNRLMDSVDKILSGKKVWAIS